MSTRRCRIGVCLAFAMLAFVATTAFAAPKRPPVEPPARPSGCEPAELQKRLAAPDSADVAKACGGMFQPWADRGLRGRGLSLRVYGRRHADQAWAARAARLLLRDAVVDTAYGMSGKEVGCDTAAHVPIYVLRLLGNAQSTVILLRFDLGAALCFDSERPLGTIALGERSDSLWAALAEVLDDDPLLRGPRPTPSLGASGIPATELSVSSIDELPEVTKRVAPIYPMEARTDNVSGMVFAQVLVGKDGEIRDVFVVSGPAVLRDAALDAIWQWRFKPAMKDRQPIAVWVMVPVKFTLR